MLSVIWEQPRLRASEVEPRNTRTTRKGKRKKEKVVAIARIVVSRFFGNRSGPKAVNGYVVSFVSSVFFVVKLPLFDR